jgi:hypothetical protein
MKHHLLLIIVLGTTTALNWFSPAMALADEDLITTKYPPCDYMMCQYEKGNIDAVILSHARDHQTIMFGEIHDSVLVGAPRPLEDSLYVISLLDDLYALGYRYLALEVQADAPPHTHSADIVRFLQDYRNDNFAPAADYPHAKPGWIELIIKSMAHGYQVIFIDSAKPGIDRDATMYATMKREIFDNNPNAKVLVYIGAHHICEMETIAGFTSFPGKRKPLGLLLSDYTNGKNYSVYMGFPTDTPMGCDLFISNFIWGPFKQMLHNGAE